MLKNTLRLGIASSVFLFAHSAAAITVPTAADIIVLMDESGSMSGEQAWIKTVVTALDNGLQAEGFTDVKFGSVGFAVGSGPGLTRTFDVGGELLFSAADFQTLNYSLGGGTEDGWAAIEVAGTYPFTPGAVRNFIMVTDEDRDNSQRDLTFDSVLLGIQNAGALLNTVVDANMVCANGATAVGITANGTGYVADGAGGFDLCAGATATGGAGSSIADYVDLAFASGGAIWDLDFLRQGGFAADSFTSAFLDGKVAEIVAPPTPPTPVSSPASIALLGVGLSALGISRRRRVTL